MPRTLNNVSKVVTDSGFIATIRLNNGLEPNAIKKAQAVVITRHMHLPQRLLKQSDRKLFPNNKCLLIRKLLDNTF